MHIFECTSNSFNPCNDLFPVITSQVQLKRLLLSFHFLISITGNKSLERWSNPNTSGFLQSTSVTQCKPALRQGSKLIFSKTSPFGDYQSWNGHRKKKGLPLPPHPSKEKLNKKKLTNPHQQADITFCTKWGI